MNKLYLLQGCYRAKLSNILAYYNKNIKDLDQSKLVYMIDKVTFMINRFIWIFFCLTSVDLQFGFHFVSAHGRGTFQYTTLNLKFGSLLFFYILCSAEQAELQILSRHFQIRVHQSSRYADKRKMGGRLAKSVHLFSQ